MTDDEMRRACRWIVSDDTGASSKIIWCVMMLGEYPDRGREPFDRWDLGRCYRLLALMPEWKVRLPEVIALAPKQHFWAGQVQELMALTTDPGPR